MERDATLLGLPYDIRYLIYEHLFPPATQVSLLASKDSITAFLPEEKFAIELLRTCRTLHAEAGAFLYGKYVFNLFGTKEDCLSVYADFRQMMQKYVREQEVRVNALSNGPHSSTMAISLGVGDAKMALVKRRGRGQPVEIEDMKREIGMKVKRRQHIPRWLSMSLVWATCVAMLAISIALLLYGRP